jgi:hypothetical protein
MFQWVANGIIVSCSPALSLGEALTWGHSRRRRYTTSHPYPTSEVP